TYRGAPTPAIAPELPPAAGSADTIRLTARTTAPLAAADLAPLAVPGPAPESAAVACPRCGGPLVCPESLKYCSACGYCGSLEQGKEVLAPPAPSPLGLAETCETLTR